MSLGRRKVQLSDETAWIFNRMAKVYAARPAYPAALLDCLVSLARPGAGTVLEIGAGTGHVSVPLAARGLNVSAVEPALAMLEQLKQRAEREGVSLNALHAVAEALPVSSGAVSWVIVADALHFLDATLAAEEIARVLSPDGGLAIVTVDFADTDWMRAVRALMDESAPRRPRAVAAAVTQVFNVAGILRVNEHCFEDETPVDEATLEGILRSISFIGPAMNAERFQRFRERLHALPGPRVWARRFTLFAGHR